MPRCHSFEAGSPCPHPARHGSPHCSVHDPEPMSNPSEPTALSVQPENSFEHSSTLDETLAQQWPADTEEESSLLPPPSSLSPDRWPCRDGCYACNARPPRCHATSRRTGQPCLFPARHEQPFCINHDPEYKAHQRQNATKGGLASARSRAAVDVENLCLWIGDRAGVQAALDTVIRLELLGRISPTRSRNILRALAIAARNFPDPRRPTITYDSGDYGTYRELIDEGLAEALEQAAARDAPPPRPDPPPPKLSLADLWAGRR